MDSGFQRIERRWRGMTDNQKIAYEWAKSHDYPSIAARYARELAGLVDDLQGAYDAMVRDLTARIRQVRQLQGEISALRQQEHFREVTKKIEPLTPEELREAAETGDPVWLVGMEDGDGWVFIHHVDSCSARYARIGTSEEWCFRTKSYGVRVWAYRQKPEEESHQ